MPDIVDPATRSRMMSGIGPTDTRPELAVRRGLFALGYRYRLHVRTLPGKPDLVLKKYRAAIFVNGCFWHGHDCHLYKPPQTRREFWEQKIGSNRERDSRNRSALLAAGWRHLTVWECALKGRERIGIDRILEKIIHWLHSGSREAEIRGEQP